MRFVQNLSLVLEMDTVTGLIIFGLVFIVIVSNVGKFKLNWNILLYLLVSILIVMNVVQFLISRGQTTAAGLSAVLILFVIYFYYVKFFTSTIPAPASSTSSASSTTCPGAPAPETCACEGWPPIVNMCPDFMAAWKGGDGETYCYDDKNTYGLRTSGTHDMPNTDAKGYLQSDLVNLIKGDLKDKKITWEGVLGGSPTDCIQNIPTV